MNNPIYKKLTDYEQIIECPDMYIGSIDSQKQDVFLLKNDKITMEKIDISEGAIKIFDEIIVNIRDQHVRDKTMNVVEITFENGVFTASNNGNNGIRVEMNEENKMYNPQLIFAELRSSGNYGTKGKLVGGKNGYGAKLTNIFSKYFIVEVVDVNGNSFYQKCEDNMKKIGKPIISKSKKSPFVKITFEADYSKLGATLNENFIYAIKKRVYDLCGCMKGVKTYYNKKLINISSFKNYISLYYLDEKYVNNNLVFSQCGERWEVGTCISKQTEFIQISFVNGICTVFGGTHVSHVINSVLNKLAAKLKTLKKLKGITINNKTIKKLITIFINCQIEDPKFQSQTKEKLTLPVSKFGSSCEISQDYIDKLSSNSVLHDALIDESKFKDMKLAAKNDGSKKKKIFIEKLIDSKHAGSNKSHNCSLILVEGDSAKTYAISGIEKRSDREYFGIFPLKGKLLNVRTASITQIAKNKEITSLKQILGLKTDKDVTFKNLRYGKIIILTDEDNDGHHIKGLLINFFERFLPGILKHQPNFITTIRTPIVKVWKKTDNKHRTGAIIFETEQEYFEWKNKTTDIKSYYSKYYKGLATSSNEEAKETFKTLNKRIINFEWEKPVEKLIEKQIEKPIEKQIEKPAEKLIQKPIQKPVGKKVSQELVRPPIKVIVKERKKRVSAKTSYDPLEHIRDVASSSYKSIDMAFNKTGADERKVWLCNYDKNKIIGTEVRNLTISSFFDNVFVRYSEHSVKRMVPSVVDGLKPSQRKILWAGIKRKLFENEIKVVQFAGYISEHASYHHGEMSLNKAIVNMAKTFVPGNNVNLLVPHGSFGSRNGEEAGAPRYIMTKLNKLVKLLFREEDESIYNYTNDDGDKVEPEYYIPILPMILINGVSGIGTGFSSNVPKFNPLNVIANVRNLIEGKKITILVPWYKGFTGKIEKMNTKDTHRKFACYGIYKILDQNTIHISELPIDVISFNAYILYLESKTDREYDGVNLTKGTFLLDYTSLCGNNEVNITLNFIPGVMQKLISEDNLEHSLRITSTINTSNMHLFDRNSKIKKYANTGEIMIEHYKVRLEAYKKRKIYYMKILQNNMDIIEWKIKFIDYYLYDKIKLKVGNVPVKTQELIKILESLSFPMLTRDITVENYVKTYSYITDMKVSVLTKEKMDELRKHYEKTKCILDTYRNTTEKQIWLNEIKEFETEYIRWTKQE